MLLPVVVKILLLVAITGDLQSSEVDPSPQTSTILLQYRGESEESDVQEVESVALAEHTPRLVVSHFAKCGGSFSKKAVQNAVPGVILNNEEEPLPKVLACPGRATFTIALIRNPFDYLVSLWTMFADDRGALVRDLVKKLGEPNHFKRRSSGCRSLLHEGCGTLLGNSTADSNSCGEDCGTLLGNSTADRNSFGEWVRHFGTERLGLVSSRFSAKYLESNTPPVQSEALPGYSNDRDDLVMEKLQQMNKDDIADCWVYTERLDTDLANCLRRFQSIGGVVDWQAFNSSINSVSHRGIPHVSCSKMFSDPQLESYVAKNEQLLSSKFGYVLACS